MCVYVCVCVGRVGKCVCVCGGCLRVCVCARVEVAERRELCGMSGKVDISKEGSGGERTPKKRNEGERDETQHTPVNCARTAEEEQEEEEEEEEEGKAGADAELPWIGCNGCSRVE
jgi:hypothetical protein